MGILNEFKEFAVKGNAMDLAVGVVIGAAFGKIVTSLVNDVIMPPIGLLLGGVDFSYLSATLREKTDVAPAVVLKYGVFINTIVDFLIVALAIFALVKGLNSMRRTKDEPPAAPPAPTREEVLLTEIRDALVRR
ncbi:MAG: large-conductance mechanosensitive channel protein MscL [Deltaproteobacteria bacterium]|nr:large-conductance mechanosensitive channel protein MscL [Deltaproteobacteria bacterium]